MVGLLAVGIKVALQHRTRYVFDRLVEVYPHVVRLRPAPHTRTPIEAYSLDVEPADHFVNWQQDAFGHVMARLVFPERARELTITVGLIAELKVINPFDFFVEDFAETFPFGYPKGLAEDLDPYLRPVDDGVEGSGPADRVRAWVRDFPLVGGTRTIDFLVAVNRAVNADVGYSLRLEPGVQTPEHTLGTRIGSCRDSAWLLVSILREFGLAARFVSGYLVQLTSDVEALDGPSGPAADFTDLHAWTEVYIPVSTRLRGCWPGKGTSRWRPPRTPPRPPRSPARPGSPRRLWSSPTPSPASRRIRGSPCPTTKPRGRRSVNSARRSTAAWPTMTSG